MARINISQILMKRGNTTAANTYVGPLGELVVDTGLRTVRVQDGVTPGGMTTLATDVQLQALGTYANATFGTSSYGNANVALHLLTSSIIGNINANITAANVNISNLTSNAATQATLIDAINANVTAANAAIISLTSNAAIQASILDTLTGNAASQSTLLDTLTSNAAAQATSLSTLLSNAVTQQTSLTDLVANAAAQAQAIANAAGTYGNANVEAYIGANIGTLYSNAVTQATSINAVTANIGSFYTYANLNYGTSSYANANAAAQATSINTVTANLGAYQTFANANAATQAGSIATLQTQVYANANVNTYLSSSTINTLTTSGNLTVGGNLIVNGNTTVINTSSYTVDDNIIQMADGNPADSLDLGFVAHRTVGATLQHTGLVRNASAGNWRLFSNVTTQPGATVDFTSAVYDDLVVGAISSPTVTDLYANAAVQSANIATLFSNAATQAGTITTLQTQVYANANVATYLPTYSGDISANIAKNGHYWTFGTDGTTLFPDQAIDGGTAPIELKSRSWSQLTYNNSDMSQQPNKNHSTTFYVEGGDALLEIFRWDSGNVMQHRQWTFSNDGSLSLPDTGTITFPDATVQNTAFSNAAVATYLSNYDGGINFTASPAVITGLGNISSANFTFANGVNILSTVGAGAYGNTEVASYLLNFDGDIEFTSSTARIGNVDVITVMDSIRSPAYQFSNGTSIFDGITSGGTTYTNANVVSLLAANSSVFIGNTNNVNTYSLQSNITQVFIGGNAVIASGNANVTNSTSLLHNMYFAANGTRLVRNTGAGVGTLSFDPTGFTVSGLVTVQTANSAPALPHWIKANASGLFAPSGFTTSTITASGTVAVNATTGIQTNQTTFPLVNQTATTILFGGAATSISMGSATIGGSGSNVFVGNAIGTSSGNLTVRAFGTYNSVNSLNSAGGYATTTYSNIAVTGGSGTGMIISMSGAASGYLASATVTNPGTGYRNGETITIPAGNPVGSLGGSFVIGNYNAAYLGQVLADYSFGIDGNLTLPGNVTIASVGSIRYANGVNYASTITGTYSNTNVAAYLTTATITTTGNITAGNLTATGTFTVANITTTGAYGNITGANVISANTVSATNYLFANGVNILSTVSAGGSYANADVAAYLAANTALYLGNPVTRYPNQANVTQMFVGNTTTIGAGSNQLGGTYILNNAYFGANGAMYARNTQTGAAQYRVSGGTFDWAGTTGAVTANSVQSFALWGQLNSSGLVTYNSIGITSAGTLTVQGASGLVTSQTTGALFNTTATTINLGGAATAINMGTSATNPVVTLGSSGTGTLVLGNATATGSFTASGNVTAASVTTLGSGGNISGVGNIVGITSNTTITAGAYVTSFLSNGAVINNTGSVVATVITTIPTTVGALPAAATSGAGARAFVTDANSTTFGAAAVGGSTNKVPVYSDGSAWYIG